MLHKNHSSSLLAKADKPRKRLLSGALLFLPTLCVAQSTDAPLVEVTVTASRIERRGFQAPTPTTALTVQDLQQTGAADIAGFLNELPAFSPSTTTTTTQQSSQNMGASFIDLRGLGAERTLVLVNSRRHVPTHSTGVVDLNVVPSVALGSVEAVTGGASAAWGSDAVAGVVNLIYDDKLEGLRSEAQVGGSTHGDGQERRFSMAFGDRVFDDRGRFLIAAEYHQNEGVNRQADRKWGAKQWQRIANPLDTGPNDGQPRVITRQNVNLLGATAGGVILAPSALAGFEFGSGGALQQRELGELISPPFMVGGSGTTLGATEIALSVPFERRNLLALLNYSLTDNVRFFFEGSYGEADAGPGRLVPPFTFGQTIGADNAFMPEQLRGMLADVGESSIVIGRTNEDLGFVTADSLSRTRRLVLGFDGELFDDWRWEVYYQQGTTTFRSRQHGNLILGNFSLATDAVLDPVSGDIVCRAALNAGSLPAGLRESAQRCVPINLFGAGAPSAAAIDYVTGISTFDQQFKQEVAAAQLTADVADLWAGPLSVAFGAEYRREEVEGVSDPTSQDDGFLFTNAKALRGGYHVRELFSEAVLPLLSSKPWARTLELNGALRWTDYSSVGEVTTSKLGLVWAPDETLQLRATVSRDIRAPNIPELYLTRSLFFFSPRDPCDAVRQAADPVIAANCGQAGLPADFIGTTGVITNITGGNRDLSEERAKTRTAGVVFTPRFLPRLRASFDWFDIEIDDAIRTLDPQAILDICYGTAAFPNAACGQIARGGDGQVTQVDATYLNIASLRTSGVDGELEYGFELADWFAAASGSVQLRLLATYLDEKSDSPDGVVTFERAGEVGPDFGGLPKWRWNAGVTYGGERFGTHAQLRYIGAGKIDNTLTAEDIDRNHVDAQWYLDWSARYRLPIGAHEVELYGGVNNVFDRDPPVAPRDFIQPVVTNSGLYDVIGRYAYLGLRLQLQ